MDFHVEQFYVLLSVDIKRNNGNAIPCIKYCVWIFSGLEVPPLACIERTVALVFNGKQVTVNLPNE